METILKNYGFLDDDEVGSLLDLVLTHGMVQARAKGWESDTVRSLDPKQKTKYLEDYVSEIQDAAKRATKAKRALSA